MPLTQIFFEGAIMEKTGINGRLSTGIKGLDEILEGGLIGRRTCLVKGGPGSGKTTLGIHFLLEGIRNNETVLFITLEEPEQNIRENIRSRGFDLSKVEFLDISPTSDFFLEVQTYDIFSPAEVDREPLTRKILDTITRLNPKRVFIDPITQFRYLNPDIFQFRKQILSFLRYLVEQGCTVLFTSEGSLDAPDTDLQFMADCIIDLKRELNGRFVSITKMRGSEFAHGDHSLKLTSAGVKVFPRLIPNIQNPGFTFEKIPSGVPELDTMLKGGIERGTITMITGPSGVGKTTLGMQFMKEAAERGERSIVYSFEEEIDLIVQRCESINIPAKKMIEQNNLELKKVEPLQYSIDEFANIVRTDVEEKGTRLVMIDSVSGYRLALQGDELQSRLHALAKFLQNMGVAVFILNEVESVTGDFKVTEVGISHIADNIIFMRYLEINSHLKKAIGVLKKRLGRFEESLREFEIADSGIRIGKPFDKLKGILMGSPDVLGNNKSGYRDEN